MTLRKTLDTLRHQLEGMQPEDPVTEIMITFVDASASEERNGPLIVGQIIIPLDGRGETITEMFEEGDPRRVMMNREK
ncbi:hypothetical protein [Lelliottia wanjuensis]|uniref:hypothetical protein n=1 Tax=Lelliottia wanjuensis TaxID=3050585 RepID=UPI00254FEB72|nr:hypothetical protein [Lelliottia sp. V104_15]MDK9606321.1 hypothetical protein [Lelliottia sp. V104_15]